MKKKKNIQKFINQTGYVDRKIDICSETDVIADNSMNKEMFLSILIDIDRPAKAFCMIFYIDEIQLRTLLNGKQRGKQTLMGYAMGFLSKHEAMLTV